MLSIQKFVGNRPLNKGKQSSYIYHDRVFYIYFTADVQYKRPICKVVYFCQKIGVFFRLYTPPLDPRRLLHMLYIYRMTFNCPKGILGLGGQASKKTERHQFHLFNGKHHIFEYISYACRKEYCKVLEAKGIICLIIKYFYFLKTYNGFTKILV